MNSFRGGLGGRRNAKSGFARDMKVAKQEVKNSNRRLFNGDPPRDTSKDILRVKI